jgi:hypothetical protein
MQPTMNSAEVTFSTKKAARISRNKKAQKSIARLELKAWNFT